MVPVGAMVGLCGVADAGIPNAVGNDRPNPQPGGRSRVQKEPAVGVPAR